MENKQVTIQQNKQVAFPSPSEWDQISKMGMSAYRSGLLPSGIKSAEAATIIALKGWELGIPIMMAFQHIHVINGKPGYSAELMQYLARKNLPGIQITILESSDVKASIKIQRPERGSVAFTFTFTTEDAKKAGLLGKDIWKQYPASMLFSRCISAALRRICPDALMGCSHTPEELGGNVVENNVIETTSNPVPSTPEQVVIPKEMQEIPIQETQESVNKIITEILGPKPENMTKPEHLTDEDLQALKALMAETKTTKQDVMHYCHTEFKKPFLAITQDEFKKLCTDIKI